MRNRNIFCPFRREKLWGSNFFHQSLSTMFVQKYHLCPIVTSIDSVQPKWLIQGITFFSRISYLYLLWVWMDHASCKPSFVSVGVSFPINVQWSHHNSENSFEHRVKNGLSNLVRRHRSFNLPMPLVEGITLRRKISTECTLFDEEKFWIKSHSNCFERDANDIIRGLFRELW